VDYLRTAAASSGLGDRASYGPPVGRRWGAVEVCEGRQARRAGVPIAGPRRRRGAHAPSGSLDLVEVLEPMTSRSRRLKRVRQRSVALL
jgi:hypothetical protein